MSLRPAALLPQPLAVCVDSGDGGAGTVVESDSDACTLGEGLTNGMSSRNDEYCA